MATEEWMSPRGAAARALADTCLFGGLDEVYGVNMTKETDAKGKTYWSVTFCKARTLDGVIRVYSERFIQVKWNQRNSEVFKSLTDAREFIINKFIRT